MTCVVIPAQPGQPPQPGYWEYTHHPGWNAGARSEAELSEDGLRVRFQVGASNGIVLGLAQSGEFTPTDPATIRHGLYLFMQGPALFMQVYERGALVSPLLPRAADDTFEIRRRGGRVRYMRNGETVMLSGQPSTGPLIVGCSLFMTGDEVG